MSSRPDITRLPALWKLAALASAVVGAVLAMAAVGVLGDGAWISPAYGIALGVTLLAQPRHRLAYALVASLAESAASA